MLRDVIRKEIMDNISSMKFVVTFVLVVVLVISGLVIGARDYIDKRDEAKAQPLRNEEMLSAQDSWVSAGYIGVFESKKPYVLSIIDHGIDNSLGRSAQVSLQLEAQFDQSRNLLAPILAVFGEVDLTFVVKIILSLFVILLTYDSISGEKERGTLKLNLANQISRPVFILGKLIGGYIVIAIAFLLPLFLGLAFMMGFYPDVLMEFDGDAWVRFSIIVGVYLLYLALFFAVGVFVSALSHRSSTSFIILLMIWVLFVTIIPRLSLTAAERIQPYESYANFQMKALKQMAQERDEVMKAFQDQQRWAKAISEKRISDMFASIFEDQSKRQQEIMQELDKEYFRQQRRQITLAETLARTLSPTSALTFAVQNLAGTGYERQLVYQEQLRAYQDNFRNYIFSKIRNTPVDNPQEIFTKLFMQEKLDVDLKDVTFTFNEEKLDTVVSRSIVDIGVLTIMTLLFFTAAYVAFMRYDVR